MQSTSKGTLSNKADIFKTSTVFYLLNHHIVFMEAHCCVYKVSGKLPKNLRKTKKNKTVRVCGSEGLDECVHSDALY